MEKDTEELLLVLLRQTLLSLYPSLVSFVSLISFAHVFDVCDLVVAQVKCVEVQHEIQSFDLSNTVVAEVQLFEVLAGGGEQLRRERKRRRGEGEGAGGEGGGGERSIN
jgi:hypothetical protein